VLELGGSHVTAALLDPDAFTLVAATVVRRHVDPHGDADSLLATIAAAADDVAASRGATWAAAVPGPFDYDTGVARYRGVSKFEALDGTDVGAGLMARMRSGPAEIRFVNDATAFGLGEWHGGATTGHKRSVAITLGTGVGSAFVDDGFVRASGARVPPEGRVDLLTIDGQPLEVTVSARAILRRYAEAGLAATGVDVVAARAADGDKTAYDSIVTPVTMLGEALAPWLDRFDATAVVVGGSISRAWSLVGPALSAGLRSRCTRAGEVLVLRSLDPEASALRGAARHTWPTAVQHS
jgi:glucokinase